MTLKPQLTIETESTPCAATECGPDDSDGMQLKSKSELAKEVSVLKDAVTRAVKERGRLPQPLFWSLFNSKIKEFREQKKRARRLEELLSKLD